MARIDADAERVMSGFIALVKAIRDLRMKAGYRARELCEPWVVVTDPLLYHAITTDGTLLRYLVQNTKCARVHVRQGEPR